MKQMLEQLKSVYPGMGESILIVDDSEEMVMRLSEDILSKAGYHVTWELDSESALSKIGAEQPELVLLDLDMPGKTGLDVLQDMKTGGYRPLVILMTGSGSEQAAIEAFRLGANEYLLKPFTTEELLKSIRQTLDAAAQRKAADLIQWSEIRQQQQNFERLLHYSKAIVSAQTVDDIVKNTLCAAVQGCQVDYSFLHLADSLVTPKTTWERHASQDRTVQIQTTNPAINYVMERGEVLQQSDAIMGFDIGIEQPLRTLLAVPVLTADRKTVGVVGIGQFQAHRIFSTMDEQFLEAMGEYAAIVLQNMCLIEQEKSLLIAA